MNVRAMLRPRLLFCAALALLALGAWLALDGLRFPPYQDELHYWQTTLLFARRFPPGVDLLRQYPELTTPLTFVLFGALRHALGWGLVAARHVNFLLGLSCALIVGTKSSADSWRGPAAAAGLMLFPHFFFMSVLYYPDMLAAALVLFGVRAWSRGAFVLSGSWFALAVSTRQYAVAFPLAAAAFGLATVPAAERFRRAAFWAPVAAVAVLGGWFALFGGYGPAPEVAAQDVATVQPGAIRPQHVLFFLACIGAYYVVPELVLLRRGLRPAPGRVAALVVSACLALAFVAFPPLGEASAATPYGFLDQAVRHLLPDVAGNLLLFVLALLALLRFSTFSLASAIVWIYAALMLKAHIAWDKYALPVLLVLWALAAADAARPAAEAAAAPRAARSGA